MSRRGISDEDRQLFEEAFRKGVAPVAKSVPKKRGETQKTNPEPQSKLDLHGLKEREAHRVLLTFVRAAAGRGLASVLIVTGKGKKADTHEPFSMEEGRRGVLKAAVPRWLQEPDMAAFVSQVRPAPRHQGGDGALILTIRKAARK
jgi:DNA-nicking Smr family endonuclease